MRTDEPFIGQYQVLEHIGSGGMADVYRARHLSRCEPEVAIKVIRADGADNPHVSRRFHREVDALARLSHPHILSPLAWGEDAGRLYLVLPWIREGTLSQLLQARGGVLPVEEALPLFGQLCTAVQYAHEQGIIHRDIKPQNVLVQDFTHVFLTDFGIALDDRDTHLTSTGGGMGSVTYMAPEQALGQPTGRSDLYSLGIVLYQLLTGVVPFLGDSPLQVLLQQAQAPPPDPRQFQPTLPTGLVQILHKALAKDPGARFESGQALWSAVQPFKQASSQVDLAPVVPLRDRPARQALPAARQAWSGWPEEQESHPLGRDCSSTQDALTEPKSIHQEKRPALGLPPRQQPAYPSSRRRSRQQHVFFGGVLTAAFLLLVGSAVLGAGQPLLSFQPTGGGAQVAQPPPATNKAVPTTGPSSPAPAEQARDGGQRGKGHGDKGHGGK